MQKNNNNNHELVKFEREKIEQQNKIDEFKDQGRIPDQQNRIKDTENLRK